MLPKDLGERTYRVLEFMLSFYTENGFPPTVREIAPHVGLSSTSTVQAHINKLLNLGYIRRTPNLTRAIVFNHAKLQEIGLVPPDQEAGMMPPAQAAQSVQTQAARTARSVHDQVVQNLDTNTISLPLVGNVAAGTPILAEQNIEDTLTLPTSIVSDASSFVLRVHGESMINAGIYDGDYIVVREQQDAYNGEIIVALVEDAATVKTFYKEANRIRLQPENDTMDPIYVDDVRILGKVTALIRSF